MISSQDFLASNAMPLKFRATYPCFQDEVFFLGAAKLQTIALARQQVKT